MAFSEQLVRLRRMQGLSQQQLADRLSVTRQAVSKWESGQAMPEADKILQLADLFSVSCDQLLRDAEPEKQKMPLDLPLILRAVFLMLIWVCGFVLLVISMFFYGETFEPNMVTLALVMMLGAFAAYFIAVRQRKRK